MSVVSQSLGDSPAGSVRDPLLGLRIAGRYLVERVHDRGGMSIVYAGLDEKLQRPVAIKVLEHARADDPVAVECFALEGRMAGSFVHANVVGVSDMGHLADGRPYLVMPLITGVDLATLLAQEGPQHPLRVAELLAGVAAALEVIHERGIVHRDIKSENLMRVRLADGQETVLVLDFGVAATRLGDAAARDEPVGTPEFMAPEALRGEATDHRGDIYALATVAFELMTGSLPFDGADLAELKRKKTAQGARSLAEASPLAFPKALQAVLARGLAQNPRERHASAGEFVRELLAAGANMPAYPLDRVAQPRRLGHPTLIGTGHARGITQPAASRQTLSPELDAALPLAQELPPSIAAIAETPAVPFGAGDDEPPLIVDEDDESAVPFALVQWARPAEPFEVPPPAPPVLADSALETAPVEPSVEAAAPVAAAETAPVEPSVEAVARPVSPAVAGTAPRAPSGRGALEKRPTLRRLPPQVRVPAPLLVAPAAAAEAAALAVSLLPPTNTAQPEAAPGFSPAEPHSGVRPRLRVDPEPASVQHAEAQPARDPLAPPAAAVTATAPADVSSISPPPDLDIDFEADERRFRSRTRHGLWQKAVGLGGMAALAFALWARTRSIPPVPPAPVSVSVPAHAATPSATLATSPVADESAAAAGPSLAPPAQAKPAAAAARRPRAVPVPRKLAPAARVGSDPRRAALLTQRATDAMLRGDLGLALRTYQQAIAADPSHAPAFRGQGLVLERKGNKHAAAVAFRRFLALAPPGAASDKIRARLADLESTR